MSEYHLIPTRYPRSRRQTRKGSIEWLPSKKPEGWVELGKNNVPRQYIDEQGHVRTEYTHYRGVLGTTRRRMTEGYISQRLPRQNSVGTNQAYIRKVIENPYTPEENRRVALQYVIDHPDRFIPVAEGDPNTDYGRWARIHNGDASFGFQKEMEEKMRKK